MTRQEIVVRLEALAGSLECQLETIRTVVWELESADCDLST